MAQKWIVANSELTDNSKIVLWILDEVTKLHLLTSIFVYYNFEFCAAENEIDEASKVHNCTGIVYEYNLP